MAFIIGFIGVMALIFQHQHTKTLQKFIEVRTQTIHTLYHEISHLQRELSNWSSWYDEEFGDEDSDTEELPNNVIPFRKD